MVFARAKSFCYCAKNDIYEFSTIYICTNGRIKYIYMAYAAKIVVYINKFIVVVLPNVGDADIKKYGAANMNNSMCVRATTSLASNQRRPVKYPFFLKSELLSFKPLTFGSCLHLQLKNNLTIATVKQAPLADKTMFHLTFLFLLSFTR